MTYTEQDALRDAVEVAKLSPCCKSKRGVVIFNEAGLIARGNNHPPSPWICDGSEACRSACNQICVHAEQEALLLLQLNVAEAIIASGLSHFDLLHVKVVDGQAVSSGPPSCVQCSKLIASTAWIDRVWLLHEDGLRCYDALDFHERSLQHHGLLTLRSRLHDDRG